jgi:predicted RNA binding protein YcfA (HicA-like mRNA interferase family)
MKKLPVISGNQAIQAFEKAGWTIARQKGSHVVLIKEGRKANLSVPLHKELDIGTLRGLIRDSGMKIPEFLNLLN